MFLSTFQLFLHFSPGSSRSRRNSCHRNCDVHHHEDRKEVAFCSNLLVLWRFLLLCRNFRGKRSHVVGENYVRHDWWVDFLQFLTLENTWNLLSKGKFTISAGNTIMPVYTAELYPTSIRNIGVGACNVAAGLALVRRNLTCLLQFK